MPDADYLYACDGRWWKVHYEKVRESFAGKRYTILLDAADGSQKKQPDTNDYDLVHMPSKTGGDFGEESIHHGPHGNSGFQAVNLAYILGAKTIILLGFDMFGTHFFGEHPEPLKVVSKYKGMIDGFRTITKSVEIINCSRQTVLDCFPRMSLDNVLQGIE